jgi:hypothetical protein
MVLLTIIARDSDGMYLCATMDEDSENQSLEEYKKKAKTIIQNSLGNQAPARMQVDDPPFYFL